MGANKPAQPPEERFWRFVRKHEDCWLWSGHLDKDGYGRIRVDSNTLRTAHRFSYTHFRGDIPDGAELDHLCRQRSCVNPAHLEPVTHKENMRRSGPYVTKTHCKAGHDRAPENISTSGGRRWCRICHNNGQRRRYWQRSKPQQTQR